MQSNSVLKTGLLVCCVVALSACGKGAGDQKTGAKSGGPVLAEVDGTKITADEFALEVKNLPPQLQAMAQGPEGKKELLDSMVVRAIVLKEAKKDGIDKSAEVERRVEDLKNRVIAEAYLKKKLEETPVSDAELQKVYEQYKDRFKHPEQVKASHILVKTEKEAQDVLAQLKQGGSFEELAKKFSTDATAAKGGDLGWFARDAMVPEFSKAAFSLKEGETSGVVKSEFGFHIVKVTGKRAAGVLPFSEVKEQLKTAVLPQKQQEQFQKLKAELKKKAKITLHEKALQEMKVGAPE